jgi:hypothetical protein
MDDFVIFSCEHPELPAAAGMCGNAFPVLTGNGYFHH